MSSPYAVTKQFEEALCAYTGAKYAVAVNSCSAALLLCCEWHIRFERLATVGDWQEPWIEIPRRTYVSVPCSIRLSGARVVWRDEDWRGAYQLKPYEIWDCARRFTSGMYVKGQYQCVSFSSSKILGIEQGGAILHDNEEADRWFRRMRFDGRTEGIDQTEERFTEVGHHMIMPPSIAAQLVLKLYHLPRKNADLPFYEYPDLSLHKVFE